VHGDASGDLLVVGWGSTKGAIEEAVDRLRADGQKVSSLHLRFIQPMPSGIGDVMKRFRSVMTVESNWADRKDSPLIDDENRRYSPLAMLLRARYLVDVDYWTEDAGRPIMPSSIATALRNKLAETPAQPGEARRR
jgi:2-oxoglutarate ferredoxin oxidoreductase subunit alpha